MAITNLSVAGLFDPFTRDQANLDRIFALANLKVGSLKERVTAQNMLMNALSGADFVVRALQSGSAATDTLVDLMLPLGVAGQLGIPFPAQSMRKVRIEAWVTGDAFATTEAGHVLFEETILGGTTPQLGLDILGVTGTGGTTTVTATNVLATNMAGARAAFTGSDPSIQFGTPGVGSLPVTITNEGAAESNSWIVKISLGRLVAFNAGT